jgi:SAM-dependent methyltransferase
VSPPSDYEKRLQQEIAHYTDAFRGRMFQDIPAAWQKAEERFCFKIHSVTGAMGFADYIARYAAGRSSITFLGLGSGACGNELDMVAPALARQHCEMRLTCADINGEILAQAANEAAKRGVAFSPLVQDINRIALPDEGFDVIAAFASLHHFLDLDHIAAEVNRALRPGGLFLTVDIPTRNGYLMWPETQAIVDALWVALPARFKFDHTASATPTFAAAFPDLDYSANSMECINSEGILPALEKNLHEIHYVPGFSIARRFFDTKFGPNYDLDQPLDGSIFEFIMQLDEYYLEKRLLKPETFFGAYTRK